MKLPDILNHYDVSERECFLWKGALNSRGYGVVRYLGQNMLVHRLSYMHHFNSDIEGVFVLHRCDTPRCMNPDHLFSGSNQDNSDDKVQKGRQCKGTSRPLSKLTEVEVVEIFLMCKAKKVPQFEIAKQYAVAPSVVSEIKNRRTWTHVTESL